DAEGRFLVDTQRTSSANLQAATATTRPLLAVYGGSLGATETFNRLSVTLRGSVDRSEFDNARLADGTIVNQSDRNLNQ
ncbi:outer membrane beta-barrel protein, partial [Escherichia coli]|nr:outer membrane beta-barrel protein [Escherichia coli]